uniref:Uncharacterized protein n=1 Tax=Arundo donax TaxID=35708 RepID=A0A0A8YUD0_ARUDO
MVFKTYLRAGQLIFLLFMYGCFSLTLFPYTECGLCIHWCIQITLV